jgi:hypothetical protein
MILRISCPSCNHIGLVAAETLPRELVCSSCSMTRHVDVSDGKAITSTARLEEWLAGERERPQVRRKTATLSSL